MKTRNIMRRLWAGISVSVVILFMYVPIGAIAHLQGNEITRENTLLTLMAFWALISIGYIFGNMYRPWYTLGLLDLPYNEDTPVFILIVRILFLWAFTVPYVIYYETMTLFGKTPADEPSPGRVSIDDM